MRTNSNLIFLAEKSNIQQKCLVRVLFRLGSRSIEGKIVFIIRNSEFAKKNL